MLERTGFVLPDVGIYTITALVDKTDPKTLTLADLDVVAEYLEKFFAKPLGKYIAGSLAFTTNGGFTQPGWNNEKFKYKREAYANFVLRGHQYQDLAPVLAALDEAGKKTEYQDMVLRGKSDAPRCVFTGREAYLRISRDMLPMFNGRGVTNFSPRGESGIPVSAEILLAFHAMPLGCLITQGALLAVESDDSALMFEYVRQNLKLNQQFSQMMHLEKVPNFSSFKTRLMDVLVEAQKAIAPERVEDSEFKRSSSLTAYHFSNYGASPRLQLYSLASNVVGFVGTVSHGRHSPVWNQIVGRAWHEEKSINEELQQSAPKITRRNFIYEDLFDLPENARDFLRTYFLRQPLRKAMKGDPRLVYDLATESDLLSWDLTELFLRKVMLMQKDRIDGLRMLGDRLANHIQKNHDRRLLRDLYMARAYWQFRGVLVRACKNNQDGEPLCSFDVYVKIFEEEAEFERPDWGLSRDLLLLRIFERLQQGQEWNEVISALEDTEEQDESRTLTE
jgi:CRISPR-associated protein Cst1